MATNPQPESVVCENDANFAVISSYILHFGDSLQLNKNINDLKRMLEETENVSEELVDLHIKLLRKRRKYINKEKWEKALVKFIAEYSDVEAWELESYGYKRVKLAIKLNAFKRLLEAQFDFNPKFKGEVNAMESKSLRILPIGRDVRGNQYWFQLDSDLNLRVYKEEPDEEKSWVMICKDKNDLCKLITDLEAGNTHILKEESSATVSENDDSNLTKELPLKEDVQIKCESTNESNSIESLSAQIKKEPENESSLQMSENIKVNGDLYVNEDCLKSEFEFAKVKEEFKKQTEEERQNSQDLSTNFLQDLHENQVTSESAKPVITSGDCNNCLTDIEILMNDLLHEVELISNRTEFPSGHEVDDIDIAVKEVCNYLLDSVSDNGIANETSIDEIVRVCRGSRGRGRPRGRGGSRSRVKGRVKPVEEVLERELSPAPVKRSLRIQALQEKKNAELAEQMKKEQQRLEEIAKKRAEQKKLNSDSKRKSRSESEYSSESESESEEETKKRKKKKRRHRKHRGYPWDSDSSPSSESSEESEMEEEEEILKFDDNEDEFACEDLEPDAEPVVLKRARTVKKIRSDSESDDEKSEEENDDTPCRRCGKYDHPEWILLCDKCDSGYHTACLNPPLMIIPDGDWFCPPCENKSLMERLQEEYSNLLKLLEKREREELRKQRLKFVAINVDNILKPKAKSERKLSTDSYSNDKLSKLEEKEAIKAESEGDSSDDDNEDDEDYLKLRSVRTCKRINYQFTEYDELINSAIRDDNYEDDGFVYGKAQNVEEAEIPVVEEGKVENNMEVEVKEIKVDVKVDIPDVEPQEIVPVVPKGVQRKALQRKKRLNDLDTPSEDDDSDESFKGTSETEVEDVTEDDEYAESVSNDDDDESEESDYKSRRRSGKSSGSRKVSRKSSGSSKKGRRGYKRDGFVVDSDDSDLEIGGSHSRVRTRAAARKKVSYKEVSSDETEEEQSWCWKTSKSSNKRKESESSDDDWGSKNKKKRKDKNWSCVVRDDDDDEEDEEEEDEDEDEDEEESDDSDAKPQVKKVEMRGKPRLSKARIMTLREVSGDESRKRKRVKIEDDDDDDNEDESEEEDEEDDDDDDEDAEENTIEAVPSSALESNTNSIHVEGLKEMNDEPMQIEQCVTTTVASLPAPDMVKPMTASAEASDLLPVPATAGVPNNQVSNRSDVRTPISSSQPSEPSALSQLTAFASRGPITSAPSPMSQPSTPFNTFSPSHPPPLVHTSDKDESDGYSITPLDNYSSRQKPLKPSLVSDSYPPQTLSPSRLLNLESGNYPQIGSPSRLINLERFHPHQMNNFDKRGPAPMTNIGNRLHPPFPGPPRDFNRRQPYPQPGGPEFISQPRHFYEPTSFPRGAPLAPNMHPTRSPSSMPFRHPSGAPPYHSSSPVGYFPQSHHQTRFYPPPGPQPSAIRGVTLPSTSSSVYSSPYPPQAVASNHHYSAYYAHSGGLTPNGGFMIQNLLQQRANASSSDGGNGTEVVAASVEEDELRSVTDIVSFITQE